MNLNLKNLILSIGVLLASTSFAESSQAAEIAKVAVKGNKSTVTLSTVDAKYKRIPLNKMLSLSFVATPASAAASMEVAEFDAVMPAHGHGMMVKPKISKMPDGSWQVDGVKLHMKGDWEIRFTVKIGESVEKFSIKYRI